MSDGDISDGTLSDGLSSANLSDGDSGAKNEDQPEHGASPGLMIGYNQTYVVRSQDPDRDFGSNHQVMFRCGNWCYTGEVSFAGLGDGKGITLKDIPRAVPMLQRQQDRLKFFCCANKIPYDSEYRHTMDVLTEAQEFVAVELGSNKTRDEMAKWNAVFPWIDDDVPNSTYFELQADLPPCMQGVVMVASKTYARGLVFIMVYHHGSFYIVMQDGEGEQALLDIRFPDVSQHGQGLHLMTYKEACHPWKKMTLWHSICPGEFL
ncbi:unnamed protein product [Choristocarpus tenellus]